MDEFKDCSREDLVRLIAALRLALHTEAAGAAQRLTLFEEAIAERDAARGDKP